MCTLASVRLVPCVRLYVRVNVWCVCGVCVCVWVPVCVCQWCRTVVITSQAVGLADRVWEVEEGRCAAFIKLTQAGSQERLPHCG